MAASPAPETRPLMDKQNFHDNFNNQKYPHETYLCYEVERLEGDLWIPLDEHKGFLHNEPSCCHAEPIFRERMASWTLDTEMHYRVTCFISYSPCENCAEILVDFLHKNKHVDLRIFAARIYKHELQDCEAGLRALRAAGAEVAMMTSKEFVHCWENFVDHQDRPFVPWDNLDVESYKLSRRLARILQY